VVKYNNELRVSADKKNKKGINKKFLPDYTQKQIKMG
jgi:hypothetical protein